MPRCFCKAFFLLLLPLGVFAQPNASFSFTNGCKGHPIQFTNISTAAAPDTIVSNTWNFGDGGTSTLKSPSHIYSVYGVFSVRLIVTTVSGLRDTVIHSVESYAMPHVSISASPFTGCQPLTVDFTNNSTIDTGSIASWLWDFDDGFTSTQQNPSHTFDILFAHTAKLVATSNKGCKDSTTRDIFVLQNPVCDFTATLISLNDSSPIVNFTNLSSGGNINLFWNFGDEESSAEYSLIHTYDSCGTYNVILTATGTNTCVCIADYILEVCDTLVQIYNSVDGVSSDSYRTMLDMTIDIFPNPSNEETITISFELENKETTSCNITDVSGRLVAAPFSRVHQQAGKHSFEINENLPAGIYFIMLDVSGRMYSRKLIVTK